MMPNVNAEASANVYKVSTIKLLLCEKRQKKAEKGGVFLVIELISSPYHCMMGGGSGGTISGIRSQKSGIDII